MKKPVDKWRERWYSIKAVAREQNKLKKQLKKTKKDVDKILKMCYPIKVARQRKATSENEH